MCTTDNSRIQSKKGDNMEKIGVYQLAGDFFIIPPLAGGAAARRNRRGMGNRRNRRRMDQRALHSFEKLIRLTIDIPPGFT